DEGYEYVVTLTLAAVMLATVGPGPLSVDALTGLAEELDGWTGLAIAAGGVVAAAIQLALSWRKPAD
ncbi:MAG: DoxX family protein, partial [Acidimicrobiia bacterium]|nr:DoxX family protein [Acidimicrobiia bacterium]